LALIDGDSAAAPRVGQEARANGQIWRWPFQAICAIRCRIRGGRGARMARLRIYGVARTRAFRAIWMAKELGLDYEHVPIEIGPAGARKPEYLALNPNGRLPTIEDDSFVLWESQAITLYLAKKHSPGGLYPATLEGEAKAWQWSLWAANEVERAVNIWSLHAV